MTDPSGSLIVRYASSGEVRVGVLTGGEVRPVPGIDSMAALLALSLAEARAAVLAAAGEAAVPVADVRLLPPIDGLTEVWASGVTYERSMDARVEESQTHGSGLRHARAAFLSFILLLGCCGLATLRGRS